jgi:hypothetical protein
MANLLTTHTQGHETMESNNTQTRSETMATATQQNERTNSDGSYKYMWLQVVSHHPERALPWLCRDERTGTIHLFKKIDEARDYADTECIDIYL